jgi:serine/threonine protein kinase
MSTHFEAPELEALAALLPTYDFREFIAQGGMGAVYLAKQRSLDRDVAIKVLPRELGEDPDFRQSFITEARAMARLNHPNLIGVYDSGDVDGMLYIVMEYVDGESLYHASYGKAVDPTQAVTIMRGVCEGIGHAHSHGIIHRDLKPANILLTQRMEAKIGDFGLARAAGRGDGTEMIMGTPGYVAPEVLTHPELADQRSDLFAVGVMLYELLTGQLPPSGSPPPPSQFCKCGPVLDQICLTAIHPSPSFRYPDATALSSALGNWLEKPALAKGLLSQAPGGSLRVSSRALRGGAPAMAMSRGQAKAIQPKAQPKPVALVVPPAPAAAPPAPADAAEGATPAGPSAAPAQRPAPPPPVSFVQPEPRKSLRYVALIGMVLAGGAVAWKLNSERRTARPDIELSKLGPADSSVMDLAPAPPLADSKPTDPVTPTPTPEASGTATAADATDTPDMPAAPPMVETPPAAPIDETTEESLARLKTALVAGSRSEYPAGAVERRGIHYLYIPTPMPWHEAAAFAEAHGGFLGSPKSDPDTRFFGDLLKDAPFGWLGIGRSGRESWSLADGSPWSLSTPPTGVGTHAAVNELGILRARNASEALPFFIQWDPEGGNPGSFSEMLKRTNASLGSNSPSFPPGAVAYSSSMFLFVQGSYDRQTATRLAAQSGGRLASLESRAKAEWLNEQLRTFADGSRFWLGGQRDEESWSWASNEAWGATFWADGEPAEGGEFLQISIGEGWRAASAESAAGLVIEWVVGGATRG